MRQKIYQALVNRHIGISKRYHKMHDGASGIKRPLSWLYLLWLNLAYYVFHVKKLGKMPEAGAYEEKRLPVSGSESELFLSDYPNLSVQSFVNELMKYDVVSFDIFDTLIFRPFSSPDDLFFMLQDELGIMDFKRIRQEQEYLARKDHFASYGNYEVTLREIWDRIEQEVGIDASYGMELELNMEKLMCYANPFMKQVYNKLISRGKTIIIISDMYISADEMKTILGRNGYTGYEKLYVSCEHGVGKCDGGLYDIAKADTGGAKPLSFIHVGDNINSDIKMAQKAGFATLYYPNVNKNALLYRSYDMSQIIGAAYRGLVNNHLYSGMAKYSMAYEYGYVYGGLFVVGYCAFIHDYCQKNAIDKILFLSRDGDILKQVYDRLYPDDATEYACWSRKAATILMAKYNRYDFIRRFLLHKVNQNITVGQAFESMGIIPQQVMNDNGKILGCAEAHGITGKKTDKLQMDTILTSENVEAVKQCVLDSFDDITASYESKQTAACSYYSKLIGDAKKVAAVDIGWAGSGAVSLNYLAKNVWKLDTDIYGIIAGTNTITNAEPDASEAFLQSGRLVSYLYSQSDNRDLLKKHDPNKDYNIFWELLLASPKPQFEGFEEGNKVRANHADEYLEKLDITLHFGRYDANQKGIMDIQKGILDFASDYSLQFGGFPYMLRISGRDAYAPMLVAASYGEKYLKAVDSKFKFGEGTLLLS